MHRTVKRKKYRGHTIEIILPSSTIQCSQWKIYDYHGHGWDRGTLCWSKREIFEWAKTVIDKKLDRERELLQQAILDIEIGKTHI